MAIFRREEIPERYRLRDCVRTPPILGIPEVGWEIATRGDSESRIGETLKGDHGQDPADSRMHGLFIAHGPAFRSGVVIDRFESIEIYNLMTDILGLVAAPNDGNPDILRPILAPTDQRCQPIREERLSVENRGNFGDGTPLSSR